MEDFAPLHRGEASRACFWWACALSWWSPAASSAPPGKAKHVEDLEEVGVPHGRGAHSTRSRRRAVRAVADGAHACRATCSRRLTAWLVAKSQGGTRRAAHRGPRRASARSPRYVDAVQRDFETLGLTWDEGPYFQHDRDGGLSRGLRRAGSARARVPLLLHARRPARRLGAASGREAGLPGHVPRAFGLQSAPCACAERTPAQRLRGARRATVAFNDLVQGPYAQNLAQRLRRLPRAPLGRGVRLPAGRGGGRCRAGRELGGARRGPSVLDAAADAPARRLLGLPHPDYAHVPLARRRARPAPLQARPRRRPRRPACALQDARRASSATSPASPASRPPATPPPPRSCWERSTSPPCRRRFPTSCRCAGQRGSTYSPANKMPTRAMTAMTTRKRTGWWRGAGDRGARRARGRPWGNPPRRRPPGVGRAAAR